MSLPQPATLSAPDQQPRAATSRIEALDGLRGIAIGLVLFHHTVTGALPEGRLTAMLHLFWSGVDLFLVLSGYLIGSILIKNRSSPKLFPVFYARRALRILPLYYLTLALIFFKLHGQAGDWAPGWYYLSFTSNVWIAMANSWHFLPLAITWSLAVEEQFYLVAPLVCRFTPRKYLGWVIASGCLLPWIARCLLLLGPESWRLSGHVLTPFRADSFAFGMLVAWSVITPEGQSLRTFLTRHWRVLAGVSALGVAALLFRNTAEASPDALLYGYTALASFWAVIVAAAVNSRSIPFLRVARLSGLCHLGRHAYFIYLWHGIVITSLHTRIAEWGLTIGLGGVPLVAVAEIGITWGLATLSWKLFENPFIKLGHRLEY